MTTTLDPQLTAQTSLASGGGFSQDIVFSDGKGGWTTGVGMLAGDVWNWYGTEDHARHFTCSIQGLSTYRRQAAAYADMGPNAAPGSATHVYGMWGGGNRIGGSNPNVTGGFSISVDRGATWSDLNASNLGNITGSTQPRAVGGLMDSSWIAANSKPRVWIATYEGVKIWDDPLKASYSASDLDSMAQVWPTAGNPAPSGATQVVTTALMASGDDPLTAFVAVRGKTTLANNDGATHNSDTGLHRVSTNANGTLNATKTGKITGPNVPSAKPFEGVWITRLSDGSEYVIAGGDAGVFGFPTSRALNGGMDNLTGNLPLTGSKGQPSYCAVAARAGHDGNQPVVYAGAGRGVSNNVWQCKNPLDASPKWVALDTATLLSEQVIDDPAQSQSFYIFDEQGGFKLGGAGYDPSRGWYVEDVDGDGTHDLFLVSGRTVLWGLLIDRATDQPLGWSIYSHGVNGSVSFGVYACPFRQIVLGQDDDWNAMVFPRLSGTERGLGLDHQPILITGSNFTHGVFSATSCEGGILFMSSSEKNSTSNGKLIYTTCPGVLKSDGTAKDQSGHARALPSGVTDRPNGMLAWQLDSAGATAIGGGASAGDIAWLVAFSSGQIWRTVMSFPAGTKDGNGLYTSDETATIVKDWEKVTGIIPAIAQHVRMCRDGANILVLVPGKGLYRSTNYGTSWTTLTNTTSGFAQPYNVGDEAQQDGAAEIAQDPANLQSVIYQGQSGPVRIDDWTTGATPAATDIKASVGWNAANVVPGPCGSLVWGGLTRGQVYAWINKDTQNGESQLYYADDAWTTATPDWKLCSSTTIPEQCPTLDGMAVTVDNKGRPRIVVSTQEGGYRVLSSAATGTGTPAPPTIDASSMAAQIVDNTTVRLTWAPATSDADIDHYVLYGTQPNQPGGALTVVDDTITEPQYVWGGRTAGAVYGWALEAVDSLGQASAQVAAPAPFTMPSTSPPTTSVTVSPTTGLIPLTVAFDGSGTQAGTNAVASIEVILDDGVTPVTETPLTAPDWTGQLVLPNTDTVSTTYSLEFTAIDTAGARGNTVTVSVEQHPAPPPPVTTGKFGLPVPDAGGPVWSQDPDSGLLTLLDRDTIRNAIEQTDVILTDHDDRIETLETGGSSGQPGYLLSTQIAAGESCVPRMPYLGASISLGSGSVKLVYAQAQTTETITKLRAYIGATNGVTPTLARMGVYSVDPTTGDLALLAASASDTTLFTQGSGNAADATLTTPWDKVAGTWYAWAVIQVGAATAPTLIGSTIANGGALLAEAPRLIGVVNGQTDLPASITAATVNNNTQFVYVEGLR